MKILKPQDVLVLLKLSLWEEEKWTYSGLAAEVHLSVAEVHASIKRSLGAKLMNAGTLRPIRANLIEFLLHGFRYAFTPAQGGVTRGIPTAWSAPVLSEHFVDNGELPLVWPYAQGHVRGEMLEPLYPSAVVAALEDEDLYACLALLDAIRLGRARERQLASDLLLEMLQ